jgi:hypothetical protein
MLFSFGAFSSDSNVFFLFFFLSQIAWMVLQVSNPSVLPLFLESFEKGIGASTREDFPILSICRSVDPDLANLAATICCP